MWQAVFDIGDEVQKSALHPRLRAMSVREGHRIFHYRGVLVCVKCGGYSMWVNRKLRLDCPGNPSELGMEVKWRTAKHHGQDKSGPSPSTGRRNAGWWWRECERDPHHLVPCPIPYGAVGGRTWARFGEGEGGGENEPFPSVEQRCPLCF